MTALSQLGMELAKALSFLTSLKFSYGEMILTANLASIIKKLRRAIRTLKRLGFRKPAVSIY
jgi:hypothetical protein